MQQLKGRAQCCMYPHCPWVYNCVTLLIISVGTTKNCNNSKIMLTVLVLNWRGHRVLCFALQNRQGHTASWSTLQTNQGRKKSCNTFLNRQGYNITRPKLQNKQGHNVYIYICLPYRIGLCIGTPLPIHKIPPNMSGYHFITSVDISPPSHPYNIWIGVELYVYYTRQACTLSYFQIQDHAYRNTSI